MNDHRHVRGEMVELMLLAVADGPIMPDREITISDRFDDGFFTPTIEEGVMLPGKCGFGEIFHCRG